MRRHFDFPLLSDADGAVARAFGVARTVLGRTVGALGTRRATFVIGTDGTILDVITSEIRFAKHGDRALETLRLHARS